jgi:hypothetical protein
MSKVNIEVQVIEALRKGIPPQKGIELYSVGHEKLIGGIRKYHLCNITNSGLIRFINGSWGSGKTHIFKLLRDVAYENNCLVSNVELNVNDAALNKFERVFYSIVRNISTPAYFKQTEDFIITPFGLVLKESLAFLANGNRTTIKEIPFENFSIASEKLMSDNTIDIDFKKIIIQYWKTYLPDAADITVQEQTRAELLQWFSGEGSIGNYRKRFGVNKLVNKENAKLMLQSLAGFVKLSGYHGLLILFDEAEQAYSIMKKSALKDAHNNLLSLINNIQSLPGLFLIYATTPDFFNDPKHGIITYGALLGRIGKTEPRPPRALDIIWNLDAIETDLTDYQEAGRKILNIYKDAIPELSAELPTDEQINTFVEELYNNHPTYGQIRFWRLLVTALVTHLDDHLEGEVRDTVQLYDDVMDRLREA